MSAKPRQALRCDFYDFVKALASRARVLKGSATALTEKTVTIHGKEVPFDFCVVTAPLWTVREIANFDVPHGMAMSLNVTIIEPHVDRYAKWDYVYTPYTPANVVHRFSPSGSYYVLESNGMLDYVNLRSDINFLFPEGWNPIKLQERLKGHLLQLDRQPQWPETVAPLGRFAKWDSRTTTDVTVSDAYKLATRWLG